VPKIILPGKVALSPKIEYLAFEGKILRED
jgi:hypothetical protein